MARRWIRLDTGVPDHRKAQSLPLVLFKFWVNCLCIAGRHDGKLPSDNEIAWRLREPASKITKWREKLVLAKMLDQAEDGTCSPHDWGDWQYETDSSTKRVKQFRERRETPRETTLKRRETVDETVDDRYGNVSASVSVSVSDSVSEKGGLGENEFEDLDGRPLELIAGRSIGEWVERFYERHPKKKNLPLVSGFFADLFVNWRLRANRIRAKTREELFEMIDSIHSQWCLTEDWTKAGARYCPKLDEWLGDEGWRSGSPPKPVPPTQNDVLGRRLSALEEARKEAEQEELNGKTKRNGSDQFTRETFTHLQLSTGRGWCEGPRKGPGRSGSGTGACRQGYGRVA